MNRSEHLQWCKDRALEYVDNDDVTNAIASMGSDLSKHPETEGHAGIQIGIMLVMGGQMDTADDARKFIEGFN